MPVILSAGGVTPDDLKPVDEDTARRVLLRAREVAPCLPSFGVDSELWKDARAILRAVAARAQAAGTGAVASQGRNGTTISYREIKSAFTSEDISGLRFLCGSCAPAAAQAPVGSFPKARPLNNLWPEGEYS